MNDFERCVRHHIAKIKLAIVRKTLPAAKGRALIQAMERVIAAAGVEA